MANENSLAPHASMNGLQSSILPEAVTANETSPLLDSHADGAAQRLSTSDDHILREWQGVPWWRRPNFYWLLFPFTLFTTAFGGVAVPRLNITLELVCRDYFADKNLGHSAAHLWLSAKENEQCQIPEVQALVSRFVLYISLLSGALSAVTAPKLGSYSDRYGRRLIIVVSSFGLLASEMATVLAAKYPHIFSVNLLLLGAVIDGLTGSITVAQAVAHSYAADCTTSARRAVSFGYFQGTLFLGIAIGPALGGMLIKATGNVLNVFYAAMTAQIVIILYVVLVLPESLTSTRMAQAQVKHRHSQFAQEASGQEPRGLVAKLKSWNPLEPLSILFPTGPGSSPRLRTNLIVLAATDTLFFGIGIGGMTVIIIYAELMFGWGNYESSIYLSFVNFTRVLMLFVIAPFAVKVLASRRGLTDPTGGSQTDEIKVSGADGIDIFLIRFAIVTEFMGYLGYALAANGSQFTLFGMLLALGSVGSPTLQSALTKHIPRDKTGQLLGASAVLRSVARVIFPTVFNLIYAETVGTFPQTVFVSLASMFSITAVCSWFITPHIMLHEDKHGNLVDGDHLNASSADVEERAAS
ncbi:tetracycline-efflux transporter-like protein [Kalaharituber pfeilii]|nr:tetracycline-efflux transporter-like protein [Kalaharituber pfeilii]